jgi:hypothetical protein
MAVAKTLQFTKIANGTVLLQNTQDNSVVASFEPSMSLYREQRDDNRFRIASSDEGGFLIDYRSVDYALCSPVIVQANFNEFLIALSRDFFFLGNKKKGVQSTNIVIPDGSFLVFKVKPIASDVLEIGDTVIGYCEGNFLNAVTYYGGVTSLMSSFTPLENKVGRIISFADDKMTYSINEEVINRQFSCGAYNGLDLLYKLPTSEDFILVSFWGTDTTGDLTWFDFPFGTILKLTDTIGDLEDSEEFIIP